MAIYNLEVNNHQNEDAAKPAELENNEKTIIMDGTLSSIVTNFLNEALKKNNPNEVKEDEAVSQEKQQMSEAVNLLNKNISDKKDDDCKEQNEQEENENNIFLYTISSELIRKQPLRISFEDIMPWILKNKNSKKICFIKTDGEIGNKQVTLENILYKENIPVIRDYNSLIAKLLN